MPRSVRDLSAPEMLGSVAITLVMAGLVVSRALAWSPLAVAGDPLLRMPGTQPGTVTLDGPSQCMNCHADFNEVTEPAQIVSSMMGQAARDPLLWAAITVAAQDSVWAIGRPNASDLCLRCHFPEGWLEERSDPTNGALMEGSDFDGVHCTVCHRLVDPFFETTYSGAREGSSWTDYWDEANGEDTPSQNAADITYTADAAVCGGLELFNGDPFYDSATNLPHSPTYSESGGGQYVVAVQPDRRGPFADANASHAMLYSRFHKSRYFCSTCHDVSNPALANLGFEGTVPGDETTVLPSELDSAFAYGHVERTFSEFMLSDFGLQGGAPGSGPFAPDVFETSSPNDSIARCQDCHMRNVSGKASSQGKAVLRPEESSEHPNSGVPAHDLTGGNALVPRLLASTVSGSLVYDEANDLLLNRGPEMLTLDLDPGLELQADGLLAAAGRAISNLQAAATLEDFVYDADGDELAFKVRNHTGHKLISGFPEGRRMWLNVRVLDDSGALLREVNPYDDAAATLKGLAYEYEDPDTVLPSPQRLLPNETHVDELVYEMIPSSSLTGESHTFHLVLADGRFKDNRIPPKGFRIAEANERHCEPVRGGSSESGYFTAEEYAGGYDDVVLPVPAGAAEIEVNLYYQTTSREYIEFLRDEINGTATTLSGTGVGGDPPYLVQTDPFFSGLAAWGDTIWQLWRHNRQLPGAAPILMTSETIASSATIVVEKQTIPDSSTQAFSFSGDVTGLLSDGERLTVTGLDAGSYTAVEDPAPGWVLRSIACNDPGSSGDLPTATASITVEAGDAVTCVFVNCLLELQLSDQTLAGFRTYEACDSITAGDVVVADDPAGTEITFRARRIVELRNGFAMEVGTAFVASLDATL